jgi:hypothetical protein
MIWHQDTFSNKEITTIITMKGSNAYARKILLMFLLVAAFYFLEYRALSAHIQRSMYNSMSILSADEFANQHARALSHQQSASPDDSLKLSKVLPMFNETGGLVVFLHIAKTGGTTIRNDFREFPNVDVKRVMDERQLNRIKTTVDQYISSNNTKSRHGGMERVLLLEIHGGHGEPMTIFEIHSYLQTLRARAAANGKNVFVFTLLREPASFYLSYFNFFKNLGCHWTWCDPPLLDLTEENLLESMVPNHQCQYLARKHDKAENRALPVSQWECEAAYNLLKADVDWIGTTENMQDTTLPLLSFMFSGNATTGRTLAVHNQQQSNNQLTLRSLSADARRRIQHNSSFDLYLYDSALRDYTLGMWDNFAMA